MDLGGAAPPLADRPLSTISGDPCLTKRDIQQPPRDFMPASNLVRAVSLLAIAPSLESADRPQARYGPMPPYDTVAKRFQTPDLCRPRRARRRWKPTFPRNNTEVPCDHSAVKARCTPVRIDSALMTSSGKFSAITDATLATPSAVKIWKACQGVSTM